MQPATLVLLPDDLTDPFPVMRIDPDGARRLRRASLSTIRSGEEGFPSGGIRRYETGDPPDRHAADMANHRVVVADGTDPIPRPRVPRWASGTTALHPDRRDLASWLDAARRAPEAPWVSHLPLVLRDALRGDEPYPDALVAMSDRAVLAGSDDGAVSPVATIAPAFTTAAHEIDHDNHRTGARLAPLPLARHPVITRAQAVLAEALVDAHDARPLPTSETVQHRWAQVVTEGHVGRLRPEGGDCFSAPLAILDDHRERNLRATLILATLHLCLDPAEPAIDLRYHWACRVHASGPIRLDLISPLLTEDETPSPQRQALIDAIEDQDLPVLELATTPDGAFEARALMNRLADATPLLAHHPDFTFVEGALAVLHWRDPAAHRDAAAYSWAALLPHQHRRHRPDDEHPPSADDTTTPEEQTGGINLSGAGAASRPAMPTSSSLDAEASHAPGEAHADEPDEDAREEDREGSGEGRDAGDDGSHSVATDPSGDIVETNLDDEAEGTDDPDQHGDDGAMGGAADCAPDRDRLDPQQAVVEALAGTSPDHTGGADDDDDALLRDAAGPVAEQSCAPDPVNGNAAMNGAESDALVAWPTALPNPPQDDGAVNAPEEAQAGEPDEEVREEDRGESGAGRGDGDASAAAPSVLDPLLDDLTDADRAMIERARAAAEAARTKRVPGDRDLWDRREIIDRLMVRLRHMLIEEPVAKPTIPLREARAVLEGDQQWAKVLLALALLWHHKRMNDPRANHYTQPVYKEIALVARRWANGAKLPWPRLDPRAADGGEGAAFRPAPSRPQTFVGQAPMRAGRHG